MDDFKKNLTAFFGPSFRAVSEVDDFDFMAILQVQEERDNGTVIALMFPDPSKNFYMEITAVEEKETEWLVTIPRQRWAFRRVTPSRAVEFAQAMRNAGVNVALPTASAS